MTNGYTEYSYGLYYTHRLAIAEAASLQHELIQVEHELIGICKMTMGHKRAEMSKWDEERKLAVEIESRILADRFKQEGIDPQRLAEDIRNKLDMGHCPKPLDGIYHRSNENRKLFGKAEKLADAHAHVSCLHLLAAALAEPTPNLEKALASMGVDSKRASDGLLDYLRSKPEELDFLLRKQAGTEYIDKYSRDLTLEARAGRVGCIVGRQEEMLGVERALLNVKKNVVLVGENGVGKNAIIEALAARLVKDRDSKELSHYRIVRVGINNLMGGEEIKPGRVLERLMNMVVEAREHKEIVFYLDDIQLLVDSGSPRIQREVAGILQPALLNGEIRCIVTANMAEYIKYIKEDARLPGKFIKVDVKEPSREETLQIIDLTREELEQSYSVKIMPDALEAAVDLSLHMDVNLCLPEKAIDLLHEACAKVRLPGLSKAYKVDTLLTSKWDTARPGEKPLDAHVIDRGVIASVVADHTGLPLEIINSRVYDDIKFPLEELEAYLKERIVGQDQAIEAVINRLILSYTGLSERKGPLATFLFIGPTGVGKTETAKLAASYLFGQEGSILRIDMSELMEAHSISKLIGSPPGYVGYEEEGLLTGWLRKRPYSVILLDEIEKAHDNVFDLFLQVFDDGRITDSKGRTAEARNAIFIMTSNLPVGGNADSGSDEGEEFRAELETTFRKEFLNRIDRVIVFRALEADEVKKIIAPIIEGIRDKLLRKYAIRMEIGQEALDYLATIGYSPRYGARNLKRTIEKHVQEPLSRMVFNGSLKDVSICRITSDGTRIKIIPEA